MAKKKSPLLVGDLPKTKAKSKKAPTRKNSSVDAKGAYGFVSKSFEAKAFSQALSKPSVLSRLPRWTKPLQKKADGFLRKVKSWPTRALPQPVQNKIQQATATAKAKLLEMEQKHLAPLTFYQRKIRPLWAER